MFGIIDLALPAWVILTFHGMNNEQQAELERLERVFAVAKQNGNALLVQNIERAISAIQRGKHSPPLIEEDLTEEECGLRGIDNQKTEV